MKFKSNMPAAIAVTGVIALFAPAALAQSAPAADRETHHPASPLAQMPVPTPQPNAMPDPGGRPMMNMGQMMPMMMPMMQGGVPMMNMGQLMPMMMPMMQGGVPMMGMGQMMPMMMMHGRPMMGMGRMWQGGMPMMGMMGQAPGAQGDAGPGMMRGGMGGPGAAQTASPPARELSADDVRRILDGMLAWHGHKRLKVAEVAPAEANTVIADITTKDGSLVERVRVDLRTGQMSLVD